MTADPQQAREWQEGFGHRLRTLRKESGLSQMALANAVGLHPTYISEIERGQRNVSLVNIRALAAALRVPVGSLFD
ncbi:helix-turn-helix domain-containing protein [Nocardioides sp. WL0053]|uniref:Helix-turn-helix domain-containing protein n=1 Tax=Nocardioides jiangsuensis TaxID=2866161 RepID=A0ABS7RI27_9ACTN|nr:helix-turn-helix transcriptional regulator [Nocardioides jiangsuensis]MBY9073435.1 helix-turn-helix domain-containing protein [Nocardioides jiangsuensis]